MMQRNSIRIQLSALLSKEAILQSRAWKSYTAKIFLFAFLGLFYGTLPMISNRLPLVVGSIVGMFECVTFVSQINEDKRNKFRATFRLMGLSDTAYFLGIFLFRMCILLSYLLSAMLPALVQFQGQIGMFSGFEELIYFIGSFLLFNAANLCYYSCIAELVKDEKTVKDVVSMIMGTIVLYPIFMCFKPGPYETTVLEYFLMVISPQGSYYYFCKALFMKRQLRESLIGISVLSMQSIIFFVGFLYLQGYMRNFSIRKKDYEEELYVTITDETIGELDVSFNDEFTMQQRPILEAINLKKRYGQFEALKGISLKFSSNEITCILGHNGAGKTTLINTLIGDLAPSGGEVIFKGQSIYSKKGTLSGKVGYCTSNNTLYSGMTVTEYLVFIGLLKGIYNPLPEIKSLIERCDLTDYIDQFTECLSGGTKRRVCIASALLGNPEIVLMDEPTSGVDTENKRMIWSLISKIKSNKRIIIMTTHHLEEAELLSNDVIIIQNGRQLCRGTPREITSVFGVGHHIIMNGVDGDMLTRLATEITSKVPEAKVDSSKLLTASQATITIPLEQQEKMAVVLGIIEDNGIKVAIESSSLEEAFIDIGGQPDFSNHSEEALVTEMMTKNYTSSYFGLLKGLFYRRIVLLFTSLLLSLKFLYVCVIPPLLIYAVQAGSSLTLELIYFLPAAIIFIFFMNCSFFAHLPWEERTSNLRFLLKIMGTDSITYYSVMIICDVIYSSIIVIINFALLLLINIDNHNFGSEGLQLNRISGIIFLTICWCTSFISQSYCIQYFVSEAAGGVRIVPLILLVANLAPLPLLFLFPIILASKIEVAVEISLYILNFLSPGTALTTLILDVVIPKQFENIKLKAFLLEPAVAGLIANPIVFFAGAMFLDFWQNRNYNGNEPVDDEQPKELQDRNALPRDEDGIEIVDLESVLQEEEKAKNIDPSIPLQAFKISKRYRNKSKTFLALNKVSLVLGKGETVGLLGPNGAGKSTFFKILSTQILPSSGRITTLGTKLKTFSYFFSKTGICPQDDVCWSSLSIAQHLRLISLLYGIPQKYISKWLELTELNGFTDSIPSELSAGMTRKLCFLMAAVHNPIYKFLDEPTSGMDPIARKTLRELLQLQKTAYNGSTILTTHAMGEAESACDKIIILINGKIMVAKSVEKLKRLAGSYTLSAGLHQDNADNGKDSIETALQELEIEIIKSEFNERKMQVDVELEQSGTINFTKLFEKLNAMVKNRNILDYSIKRMSLDDVFAKISILQKPHQESE